MKRLISVITFLLIVFAASAQTPEEILNRMSEELSKHESDGICMITDVKVPVVGTLSTKTYSLGEKLRMETTTMGIEVVIFEDEEDNVKGSVRVLKYNDLSEDYKNGIDGVKEGGVSKVINGEYGYYVVKILNTDDSEHADLINDYETSKKTNEAKEKLYNKLFDTYVGADKEYRNDEIWNTINITDYEKSE